MPKKKKATEPFLMLFRTVVNSYAWRAASGACHKAIYRIAEENMAHGGTQNGDLEVTNEDLFKYGIRHHDSIAPALREACALGLIIMTHRGRAGNAEHRSSHRWALAFVKDGKERFVSTEWQRFKSLQEARAVAKKARAEKDTRAVEMGKKRAAARHKIIHFPTPESGTENSQMRG